MIFEKVRDFHTIFGQLVAKKMELPSEDVRQLRRDLLAEEYNELLVAESENDIIEVADAFTDIVYILSGTVVSYGLAIENWTPTFFHVVRNPADDAQFPDDTTRANHLDLLKLYYATYLKLEEHNDIKGIGQSIYAILNQISEMAYAYHISLKDCFICIHENNLSKLDENGNVVRFPNGKVKKPDNYKPVDLRPILFKGHPII